MKLTKKILFTLIILSFFQFFSLYPSELIADTIHFDTGNKDQPKQWWFGKILKIENDFVYIKFMHHDNYSVYKIHVSRILSIYFDDSYEHIYPINLSGRIEQALPANLDRLRKLYLFTNDIEDDFPQLKVYGPSGNKSLKGNIIKFDSSKNLIAIHVKSKNGNKITVDDSDLISYLRSWVR